MNKFNLCWNVIVCLFEKKKKNSPNLFVLFLSKKNLSNKTFFHVILKFSASCLPDISIS